MAPDALEGKLLVQVISELLEKHNCPNPRAWEQGVHPDAFTSPDRNVQRFLINRYWRQVVGLYPGNTIPVRHCLVDQGNFEDWVRLFEQGVVPYIVKYTQA